MQNTAALKFLKFCKNFSMLNESGLQLCFGVKSLPFGQKETSFVKKDRLLVRKLHLALNVYTLSVDCKWNMLLSDCFPALCQIQMCQFLLICVSKGWARTHWKQEFAIWRKNKQCHQIPDPETSLGPEKSTLTTKTIYLKHKKLSLRQHVHKILLSLFVCMTFRASAFRSRSRLTTSWPWP